MKFIPFINNRINYDLFIILLFGALLRFPGIFHGLPTYVLPSEAEIVSMSISILKGELFPSWIFYGGLYFYLNSLLIGTVQIFYHFLHLIGLVQDPNTPYTLLYAASRSMNIFFGLVLIASVYGIANRLSDRRAGIIAALIMTLLPLSHNYSLRIAPDMLCTTLASVSIYFSIRHLSEEKGNKWLWFAALFSGLAIGTKFMFFSVVPFCLAKYFRDKEDSTRFFDKHLVKAFGIVILTFFITTPAAILYIKEFFINGLFYVHNVYSSETLSGDNTQNVPFAFIKDFFLYDLTPGVFLVSVVASVIYTFQQFKKIIIIFSGPMLWTIFMSFYQVDYTHNIMILLTPLSVCAGIFLNAIANRLLKYVVILMICIYPFMKEIAYLNNLLKKDIRYIVSEWVDENLPQGSCVVWEDHRPFFKNKKYTCIHIGTSALAYMEPEVIRSAGYEYVISEFHEQMKQKPRKFSKQICNYEKLLDEFTILKVFDPGSTYRGHTIRIIKIE